MKSKQTTVGRFPQSVLVGCLGYSYNFKTVLQNLPPRAYRIWVYAAPWTNPGSAAVVGVGKISDPAGCGNNNPEEQKLIVSVSQ